MHRFGTRETAVIENMRKSIKTACYVFLVHAPEKNLNIRVSATATPNPAQIIVYIAVCNVSLLT